MAVSKSRLEEARAAFWYEMYPSVTFTPNERISSALDALIAASREDAIAEVERLRDLLRELHENEGEWSVDLENRVIVALEGQPHD